MVNWRGAGQRCGIWAITRPLTKVAVWRARLRRRSPGVTVITVSFNTLPYLQALVAAVQRRSPAGTKIIVIDNASNDGSAAWARRQPEVYVRRLPLNIHHGPAMNLGVALCRTEFFIALDVDAFPVSDTWIEDSIDPLLAGAEVSGAGYPPVGFDSDFDQAPDRPQPYIHACWLAMRTDRFLGQGHTFSPGPTWDTAQAISLAESPAIHPIPISSSRGPGILGSVFGNAVYHNFYSARFTTTSRDRIDWVDRGQPEDAWAAALAEYFPEGIS